MKPSHFHMYSNKTGRSDPQFEDADEGDNYLPIPGSAAHAEMARRGVFNTAGSRFGSAGMALANPHSVFSVHSAPSVMIGHPQDNHRSLLLQSAMMNQPIPNHGLTAVHPHSLRGANLSEAAYLTSNAPMFNRPGTNPSAAAAVSWHQQQQQSREQQMALGAMQSLSYRSPPKDRMHDSNTERHQISRSIFSAMLHDTLLQETSQHNHGDDEIRRMVDQEHRQRCLDAGPTSLNEASLTQVNQEMYSSFGQPLPKFGISLPPPARPQNHSSSEDEDEYTSSTRKQIARPSEAITAAMLESVHAKADEKTPIKNNNGHTPKINSANEFDGSGEWEEDRCETGFSALLAASFQADFPKEKKRKIKACKVESLSSIDKKAKRTVGIECLDSNVTEFTTTEWRCAYVPLSLAEDKYWLSDLQCFIRLNFVEVFGATEGDLTSNMQGRSRPTFIGQVGIRCMHCKRINFCDRGQNHVYFPSSLAGLYNCVQALLRTHLECCTFIAEEVREKIDSLKSSSSSRGGRKQYWIDSAKKLGMADTSRGIIFEKDPVNCKAEADAVEETSGRNCAVSPAALPEVNNSDHPISAPVLASVEVVAEASPASLVGYPPLVFPRDKHLISEVLYVAFQNMHKAPIVESDQVGCYKNRPLGFIGLSCNHCVGQAGCGRYFPANEASLSQTTTSQTLLNHVRKCRRAPAEVGLKLDSLMRTKLQKGEKPRHGGRKVFFHRLWCRMQGIPEPSNDEDALESNMRRNRPKSCKRIQKGGTSDSDSESESDNDLPVEDFGTVVEMHVDALSVSDKGSSHSESENENIDAASFVKSSTDIIADRKNELYFSGAASLAQSDDAFWLSDLECFARSECLEVFSATKIDADSSSSSENIREGQIGLRCLFCSKSAHNTGGADYITHPNSINEFKALVNEMAKLHLASCPNMPENTRQTFKSLQGYGSRPKVDAAKFWVDAAKETGMSDWPDGTVRFFRDPSVKGAAERLFLSMDKGETSEKPQSIVRKRDRKAISDHLFFLLSQLQICSYDASKDRRRGRATIKEEGFRGVECSHCADKGTKKGRYFPVSAKLFCDGTSPNIHNHLLSCEFCPEDVKSSLEYLNLRVSDEKTRLRSGWRKRYYAALWERIHAHKLSDEEKSNESDEETVSEDSRGNSEDSDSESMLGNMMIDAAARWLTELGQAEVGEFGKKTRGRKHH